MIKRLFKGILSSIAVTIWADYRRLSVQLIKTEAVKSYLHGVRAVRLLTLFRIRTALIIAFILLGALLFHAGLFIALPWTLKAKAILCMCLGLGYMICGGLLLRAITDEKMWMEKSGAAQLLAELTAGTSQTET